MMAKGSDHIHFSLNVPRPTTVVMVGGRMSGKTTSIVEALRWDPEGILVVHNQQYADELERKYPHLKGRVMDPNREKITGKAPNIYVDNAELVLANLLGGLSVRGITINGRTTQ